MFTFDVKKAYWINEPKGKSVSNDSITIITEPETDFWQRTYYGFHNDTAPALLLKSDVKYFSFIVKAEFDSEKIFDQCGVIIYQDSDNWFKASIEYQNEAYSQLGSVVTNDGFSDWATTDISSEHKFMYYRLSRRESDFRIENSYDGIEFKQMRIFHLAKCSETISFGVYACSPVKSSFEARFSELKVTDCVWEEHSL